ncbi:MAG: N-acetylmuramoyl-L-alanine amidase [Verrucomicrobiota bacterium]
MSNPIIAASHSNRKRPSVFALLTSAAALFLAGCATGPTGVTVHDTSRTFNTVVVDAGHGGKDSGVNKGGIAEKVAALDVAQNLSKKLRAAGFHTVMTRNGDYFIELNERAAISNRQTNSIFVSIHFNDSRKRKISGVDTYYNSAAAQPLAARIEKNLSTVSPNRGIHFANYRVLRLNKYPAVLVECGFLSNGREAGSAKRAVYREKIATLIAQAIIAQRGQ